MSLIHTAERANADPFDFLVTLQRYHDAVADHPDQWMPWNYRDALARLTADPDDSG